MTLLISKNYITYWASLITPTESEVVECYENPVLALAIVSHCISERRRLFIVLVIDFRISKILRSTSR